MEINDIEDLQQRARELEARLGPQLEQARKNLSELNRRVAGFIKENPGTCLLGAVAVGFVVGKLVSRK
jgi:ElaB/YqjD/DUF883 family membrane-anchored ribosome-binding protein